MSRSFPKTQSQLFNLIFCNFAQISYILAVKCSKLNELHTKESIRIVTHLPARYIVQITDNQLIFWLNSF